MPLALQRSVWGGRRAEKFPADRVSSVLASSASRVSIFALEYGNRVGHRLCREVTSGPGLMPDFFEVNGDQSLAIVAARPGKAMALHDGPCGLGRDPEAFGNLGVGELLNRHRVVRVVGMISTRLQLV